MTLQAAMRVEVVTNIANARVGMILIALGGRMLMGGLALFFTTAGKVGDTGEAVINYGDRSSV
jgi:hypothetical protein